jgi:mono/diheme cytochrome c family protein
MAVQHGGAHWMAPPEAAARPNPVPMDDVSIARGRAVFAQNCAVCHGVTGRGDSPLAASLDPSPADLKIMAPQHPPGDIAWKIAEWRGAMPSWQGTLSDSQIWDTVNFIKSLPESESANDGSSASGPSHHDHDGKHHDH